jgi:diguanylate cyclase (GGDEF)-like protein/PAS domain S-box-containing protein
LENNNNVIYKINTMGEITYISPTIKLLTGYDSNEVIGRHISKFIIPEDYPLVQERMSSIYKGNTAPIEFRIVYKDGEIRYARATSLTDIEGGKLKGLIGIITDITELRYKENDLLLARKALDSTSNPALLTDLNGKEVLYQNKAFCRLSGYSQKDINEAGGARVLYHCPAVAFGVYSTIIKGESWKGELDLKTKDGRSVPVHLHTSLVMSNRKPIGCFGVFVDMTEQRKLEEERQAAYQKLYDTIEFLPDPTFVVDKDRRVVEWNRALELITGRTKEEMLGRDDYSMPFYGKKRPTLVDLVLNPELANKNYYDEIIRKERYLIGEGYAFGYRGKVKYFRGTASAIYNRNGEIIGAIESMRDISERKEITEQLKRYALYDSLTGLYNRNYFQEELSRKDKFKTAGIITCDIDGLKLVNDTLGHEKGNSMLTEAAAIIKNCFTESNIVARISGDEFAAVFYNVTEKEIEAACNRLRGMVKERNSMHEDMPLSLSVGYAVDDNTTNLEELFGLAENNMYREKLHRSKSGKSAVVQT